MKIVATVATLAFVLGLHGGPAVAQTTDCDRTLTGYSCETSASPAAGFMALGNAIAARNRKKAMATQMLADINAGNCSSARSIAATYGDANDVAYVAQNCVSVEQLRAAEFERARQMEEAWLIGIAKSVKEGRCEEAKQNALTAGRFDVAEQAMRLCTPAQP